jgi:hypothetical protein
MGALLRLPRSAGAADYLLLSCAMSAVSSRTNRGYLSCYLALAIVEDALTSFRGEKLPRVARAGEIAKRVVSASDVLAKHRTASLRQDEFWS